MADRPKVLVAEPIYQALPPRVYMNRIEFWRNVFACDVAQAFYSAKPLIMGPRRNIRSARSEAIRIAREEKATHIFFMDDDILVPDHILQLLLRVDQDIVGGLMHKDDGKPIVFRKELVDGVEDYWTDHPKEKPFECGGVGAGCMLVRMRVFDDMQIHWPERHWFFNYDETGRSMDLRFCRNAMSISKQVWCVPYPECTQLTHY